MRRVEEGKRMNAIQIFSSRPILAGRNAAGVYKKTRKIELPEVVELTMQLSPLQWRRTNGPVTLYTDLAMKKYLEKKNLLKSWDSINIEVLENFYATTPNINHAVFWSAGKFACYLANPIPFACIDTDFITWQPLKFDRTMDFAFAHWETVEHNDKSYPSLNKIHTPQNFQMIKHSSRLFKSFATNMSFSFFNNEKFKNDFAEAALNFMRGNDIKFSGYAVPEILYAEQRIPLALLLKRKLKFAPIIVAIWSPKQFRLIHSEFENWFFSDLNFNRPIIHLWFHKNYLFKNPEENARYCEKLRKKILA